MFYVSSEGNGRYGVTDTKDNVEEYYTKQELLNFINQGVSIKGYVPTSDIFVPLTLVSKSTDKAIYTGYIDRSQQIEGVGSFYKYLKFGFRVCCCYMRNSEGNLCAKNYRIRHTDLYRQSRTVFNAIVSYVDNDGNVSGRVNKNLYLIDGDGTETEFSNIVVDVKYRKNDIWLKCISSFDNRDLAFQPGKTVKYYSLSLGEWLNAMGIGENTSDSKYGFDPYLRSNSALSVYNISNIRVKEGILYIYALDKCIVINSKYYRAFYGKDYTLQSSREISAGKLLGRPATKIYNNGYLEFLPANKSTHQVVIPDIVKEVGERALELTADTQRVFIPASLLKMNVHPYVYNQEGKYSSDTVCVQIDTDNSSLIVLKNALSTPSFNVQPIIDISESNKYRSHLLSAYILLQLSSQEQSSRTVLNLMKFAVPVVKGTDSDKVNIVESGGSMVHPRSILGILSKFSCDEAAFVLSNLYKLGLKELKFHSSSILRLKFSNPLTSKDGNNTAVVGFDYNFFRLTNYKTRAIALHIFHVYYSHISTRNDITPYAQNILDECGAVNTKIMNALSNMTSLLIQKGVATYTLDKRTALFNFRDVYNKITFEGEVFSVNI